MLKLGKAQYLRTLTFNICWSNENHPQSCHEFLSNCFWNCESQPTNSSLLYSTLSHPTQFPAHTQCCWKERKKSPLYWCGFYDHGQNCSEYSPAGSILWEYILSDSIQVWSWPVGIPCVNFYFCHCQRWHFHFSILFLRLSYLRIQILYFLQRRYMCL